MFGLKKREQLVVPANDPVAEYEPLLNPVWIRQANERTKYTPDMWRLEEHDWQLLFVYGEEQKGLTKHYILEDQRRLCWAFSLYDFNVWKRNIGENSFAIGLEKKTLLAPSSQVKGELYAIRPTKFLMLDSYKQNGVHFYRKRITVDVPYRHVMWLKEGGVQHTEFKHHALRAWAYFGIQSHWDDQLDAGFLFKPVSRYHPNQFGKPSYYAFTKREYRV